MRQSVDGLILNLVFASLMSCVVPPVASAESFSLGELRISADLGSKPIIQMSKDSMRRYQVGARSGGQSYEILFSFLSSSLLRDRWNEHLSTGLATLLHERLDPSPHDYQRLLEKATTEAFWSTSSDYADVGFQKIHRNGTLVGETFMEFYVDGGTIGSSVNYKAYLIVPGGLLLIDGRCSFGASEFRDAFSHYGKIRDGRLLGDPIVNAKAIYDDLEKGSSLSPPRASDFYIMWQQMIESLELP